MKFVYDGSFEGFLSVVFEIFDKKIATYDISRNTANNHSLFEEPIYVITRNDHADRVFDGLQQKAGKKVVHFIYSCFLSEQPAIENQLVYLIRLIFSGQRNRFRDFGDPIICELHQIKKMVGREVHRMHAFVRFQLTKDNIYTAICNPDFNVLPLIGKHFKGRYPVMNWLIYDVRRSYGIYYDQKKIDTVTFTNGITLSNGNLSSAQLDDIESSYQQLWQAYFKSVNITERNNKKLHERHVPRRYWSYLVEKW